MSTEPVDVRPIPLPTLPELSGSGRVLLGTIGGGAGFESPLLRSLLGTMYWWK